MQERSQYSSGPLHDIQLSHQTQHRPIAIGLLVGRIALMLVHCLGHHLNKLQACLGQYDIIK